MGHTHDLSKKIGIASVLITLGIVFGDIGTSPLYVFKSIIGEKIISQDLVYGGLSCVFWTLTLQTTIKYVLLTLRADNHGEGGILSLYALIRKRYKLLVIPAIVGAAALLADGMITPPISVASAVEGLQIIRPHIPIVPIVIVIIVILFSFQRLGTSVVGKTFGPVMLIWFLTLAIAGGFQIYGHPEILQALNPHYGYNLLVKYPGGFWLLGAIFLCTTGAEALYSDLGHCGRKNIQIAWIVVKISLLLNYFGQGAWLIQHEGYRLDGKNPFFFILPESMIIPAVILATCAAIIASQALISGSYTLISESLQLNLWPKVKINYPTIEKGKLYIPSINFMLMIGCIIMVLYFKESTAMEAAYGLAITVTMLSTSILLGFYLKTRKTKRIFIIPIILLFIGIEIAFLIANLDKFPHGGWVTLLVSLILITVMFVWYNARKIKNRYNDFVNLSEYLIMLNDLAKDEQVPKYATHLVYMTSADNLNEVESKIIYSIFNKRPKRADVYWFVHVHYLDEPHTQEYKINILVPEKVIKVEFRLGFRIQPRVNLFMKKVIEDMKEHKEIDPTSRYESLHKYKIKGDFQYIVIDRFLNYDYKLSFFDEWIISIYKILRWFSLSDARAFGLDSGLVSTEKVPLITSSKEKIPLKRVDGKS